MFQTEVSRPQEIENNSITVQPLCSMNFSCFRDSKSILHGDMHRKRADAFIKLSSEVGGRATKEVESKLTEDAVIILNNIHNSFTKREVQYCRDVSPAPNKSIHSVQPSTKS